MPRLILGHTRHNGIKIWVRGSRRWPVAFVDVLDPKSRKPVGKTRALELSGEDFYTGVVDWKKLLPEREYVAKVAFGKTKQTEPSERVRKAYTEGRFKTFADPKSSSSKFTFLLGSCNLHSLGWFEKPDKAWVRVSSIAKANKASFMLHCGDQIYADIPLPPSANHDHFRDKYLDAWSDCVPARRVLTELPHYMILDDHEITNNFDHSDGHRDALLDAAMKVYYEFQHKHNPDTPGSTRYYYSFQHGPVHFFVLDTRFRRDSDAGQMIDPPQLRALKSWMSRHHDAMKFIVTSVPFVGEVKRPRMDKWCDPVFEDQRGEILEHIVRNDIRGVTFLTGDMHHSYHASMDITYGDQTAKVNELMSSPINQFTPNTKLDDKYRQTHNGSLGDLKFTSRIDRPSFYGSHSNVMAIEVAGALVKYRIYRTTKSQPVARLGSFRP